MAHVSGTRLKLSAARKVVLEQLHHAQKIPSLPLAKTINVADLVQARREGSSAPSWIAIFMRAYALVGVQHPELRRAFIPWPYPHLYEHPHMTCGLLIEREWDGEAVVLGSKVVAPERLALDNIDRHIRWCRETPVWEVGDFRQALRIGGLPAPLRRFTFWQTLYISGYKRCKRMGTFIMSSLGNMGVEQYHPLGCLTTYFTFGPISTSGDVVVKIIYDHRVMDGRCVAHCLNSLERVLHTQMLGEIRSLPRRKAASSAA